jgi:hypothetical protein
VIAGPIFAAFAYTLLWNRLESDGDAIGILIVACMFGGMMGGVCLPLVYFMLFRRDVRHCLPRASWSVLIVIIVVAILPYQAELLAVVLLFGAPAVLVVACASLALWTPRLYFGVDICRLCGYDLRASLELGRCPECGWQFQTRPWKDDSSDRQQAGVASGLAIWLFQNPLVLACIYVVFALVGRLYQQAQCAALQRQVAHAVHAAAESDGILELDRIASFDWETVHVISGYSQRDDVARQLGFDWPEVGQTGIAMSDGIQLLVFVKHRRVVRYCELPVWGKNGVEVAAPSPFTPETRVRVLRRQNNEPVKLLPLDAADSSSNGFP